MQLIQRQALLLEGEVAFNGSGPVMLMDGSSIVFGNASHTRVTSAQQFSGSAGAFVKNEGEMTFDTNGTIDWQVTCVTTMAATVTTMLVTTARMVVAMLT